MSDVDCSLDLDGLQLLDGDEAHLMAMPCTVSCLQSCQTTCKVIDFP